jgi:hypothetical protein
MEGHFERGGLLGETTHAAAVYGSIGMEDACDESGDAEGAGVFEILLDEGKFGLGVDEVSSAWAKDCVYGQVALEDCGGGESVAWRETAFAQCRAEFDAIRSAFASGDARVEALRTYLEYDPAIHDSTSGTSVLSMWSGIDPIRGLCL